MKTFRKMYMEIYGDSLFLVNFVFNLYIGVLMNRSLYGAASTKRLLVGAFAGAVMNLIPFVTPGRQSVKILPCVVAATIVMIVITFPVKTPAALCKLCLKYTSYACFFGGTLVLFLRLIPGFQAVLGSIGGLLALGLLIFLWFAVFGQKEGKEKFHCQVTLIQGDKKLMVEGVLDSGNTLVEPISRKPVCIINRTMKEQLFQEDMDLYRAIPFHSIGRKKGILKGYLLDELRLEYQGVEKTFEGVYVAASEEEISSDSQSNLQIIVNPMLYQI